MAATAATICVWLQLTTAPKALPSHTLPLPCAEPKPEPVIVICEPGAAVVEEIESILGGVGAVSACTVTEVVACVLPSVAVMVAVPAFAAIAKPGSVNSPLLIKTVEMLEELQVTLLVRSCTLLSANVPV